MDYGFGTLEDDLVVDGGGGNFATCFRQLGRFYVVYNSCKVYERLW